MVNDHKLFKHELQHLILSDESDGQTNLIKTAQTCLRKSTGTGSSFEKRKPERPEEERALESFANQHSLWLSIGELGVYITEGAEQKVYFPADQDFVLKVADAVFYLSWYDYFNNLLLHNFFFPATSYELAGFIRKGNQIFAVLKQPFVESDSLTDLSDVKFFLEANGFVNKKTNDYFHPHLGIILEDLHDENVLTNKGVLFFVDTVFYIDEKVFWLNE